MLPKKTALIFVVTCVVALLDGVENKSVFGIGQRFAGDQLLVKDVLLSRLAGSNQNPSVMFNYAIPEPITYIEILSEENVQAEVNFSYQNDLVKGAVTAINAADKPRHPFEAVITIFGFNETVPGLNSRFVQNQIVEGLLEHVPSEDRLDDDDDDVNEDDEYLDEDGEDDDIDYEGSSFRGAAEAQMSWQHETSEENADGDEDEDEVNDFATNAEFDDSNDKIIEVGRRQPGDYMIYETFKTSSESTQQPDNHTVVFYYIDSNYITYAKFVIVDHFSNKPNRDYIPAQAEYTHFSPNTLKATITDYQKTNLFVQMFLYGYKPEHRPVDYEPFLASSMLWLSPAGAESADGKSATDSPVLTPLQRLKKLFREDDRVVDDDEATSTSNGDDNDDDEGADVQAVNNKIVCIEKAPSSETMISGTRGNRVPELISIFTPTLAMAVAALLPILRGHA